MSVDGHLARASPGYMLNRIAYTRSRVQDVVQEVPAAPTRRHSDRQVTSVREGGRSSPCRGRSRIVLETRRARADPAGSVRGRDRRLDTPARRGRREPQTHRESRKNPCRHRWLWLGAGFSRDRIRRKRRAPGVHSCQTHIPVERVVVARRRLIPDVEAAARRDAVRLLDGRIARDDVPSDPAVGRRREHHDAVRVANGRVRIDQVVVA